MRSVGHEGRVAVEASREQRTTKQKGRDSLPDPWVQERDFGLGRGDGGAPDYNTVANHTERFLWIDVVEAHGYSTVAENQKEHLGA